MREQRDLPLRQRLPGAPEDGRREIAGHGRENTGMATGHVRTDPAAEVKEDEGTASAVIGVVFTSGEKEGGLTWGRNGWR